MYFDCSEQKTSQPQIKFCPPAILKVYKASHHIIILCMFSWTRVSQQLCCWV